MLPKKLEHTRNLQGTALAKRHLKTAAQNTGIVVKAVGLSPKHLYQQITTGSTNWIDPFIGQQRSIKRTAYLQAQAQEADQLANNERCFQAHRDGFSEQLKPGHAIDEQKAKLVLAVYQDMHAAGKLTDDELERETKNLKRGYVWAHQLTNGNDCIMEIGRRWLEQGRLEPEDQSSGDGQLIPTDTFFVDYRPAYSSDNAANVFFNVGHVRETFKV
jgi:hypothetical protein